VVADLKSDKSSNNPDRSNLAEWSRPERAVKNKLKEESRALKGPGRPATKQPNRAARVNWYEPHLWAIITSEAEFVRGMSPKELQDRLRLKHPVLFGHISAQVLGRMMEMKDGRRVWSADTLEKSERQNGHDGRSTRNGILVWITLDRLVCPLLILAFYRTITRILLPRLFKAYDTCVSSEYPCS